MSQLFDALHKAESERRPNHKGAVVSGPELLEVAEREFRQRQSKAIVVEESERSALEPLNSFEAVPNPVAPNEKLVCVTDPRSLAAEKFRFLGLRLTHLQQRKQIKTLLITSSLAEEGKSMIAANLACALARHERKVLLVEGDLRRPGLAGLFGVEQKQGIGDYVQNRQDSTACIYELEGDLGLYFLPAGD